LGASILFSNHSAGYLLRMPRLHTRMPCVDELWLSRPPYLMIARIVEIEQTGPGTGVVSYVLYDEAGSVLEHVSDAELDAGWWGTFQPLTRRQG
jgi:hypothetical protein